MPSQDLTVRVKVDGMGGYTREMQKGAAATKQFASSGDQIKSVGQKISGIGDNLTKKVTLPIVAVGAAATKLAMDFDDSFTKMQTLAGVSGDAVAGMKDQVLALAGETGKAPQELADAMYFLASSGLSGAEAMDALTVSAKASAAGLGPTETIADAVSSAMLGYAESGLKASEATDVLIATARAGKAEPAELAAQMGRLIPTAAELGIKFADVGGAIAALSTKGNDAAAATTQLTNVMGKLMKPSQQANEALEGVGLSTDRIRDLISEKGLLGTLEVLKERLGDSGFVKFFEDQQAVQGALALTGGDLQKTRDIFEQVNDSVGATDKAFATWADSMGAKNARAFADFQVALIRLGDVIAPIAADVLSFAAGIAEKFSNLPTPIQKLVVAFLAVAAAIGPLLSVGGRLISMWGSVVKAFDNVANAGGQAFAGAMNGTVAATNNAASAFGRLKVGLAQAAIAFAALDAAGRVVDAIDPVKTANVSKLTRSLQEFASSGHVSGEASKTLGDDFDKLADAMHRVAEPSNTERISNALDHITPGIDSAQHKLKQARQTIDDVDQALADLAATDPEAAASAFREISSALEDEGIKASQTENLFDKYASVVAQSETANEAATRGAEGNTEALADQEQAVNEAAEAYGSYTDAIKASFDPLFGLLDALHKNQDAQRGVTEAEQALADAQKEHGRNSSEAAQAQRDLRDAIEAVGSSALDVNVAAATLNAAVAENPALVEDAMQALQDWREQGLIPTDAQLRQLQGQLEATADQGKDLDQVSPNMEISSTGGPPTRAEMRRVKDAATSIPTSRTTRVSAHTAAAAAAIGNMLSLISQLPSHKTVTIEYKAAGGAVGSALAGQRATGGPVSAGRLYEVAERGRAELLEMGGRSYLIPGTDGKVIPADAGRMWHPAMAGGGGASINVNVSMAGAIIASQSDAERWVSKAWNGAAARGLVNVRGKRVA